jgi:hypothetical protein
MRSSPNTSLATGDQTEANTPDMKCPTCNEPLSCFEAGVLLKDDLHESWIRGNDHEFFLVYTPARWENTKGETVAQWTPEETHS